MDAGQSGARMESAGKVPVLVLDDGTHLFDSRVIVEYLDTVSPVSRLIPEPSRQRIAVKRWEALADGVCDAAVAMVLERRRPPPKQSKEWIARQQQKLVAGVAEFARELGDRPGAMAKPIRWPTSPLAARLAISSSGAWNSRGATSFPSHAARGKNSPSDRRFTIRHPPAPSRSLQNAGGQLPALFNENGRRAGSKRISTYGQSPRVWSTVTPPV